MLESLLTPRSIAVIGASRTPGKVGHDVVANLVQGGFAGPLVPVNPSADEVCGFKCYPKVSDYPGEIDLGVIVVPPKHVLAAAENLIDAGAKAIITITAGFKEVGPEGAKLEAELAALCRGRGVRLMGPNVLGVINTHHKMNASFAHHLPKPGDISVLSQSGAICTAILDWAAGRHLGLAKLISIGNKADVSEIDLLYTLAEDPETRVIVGYLESIVSGDAFIRAAEEAASRKPVVIFKAGTTSAGVKAASSHTGSLAGANVAYGAAFKRSGVVRADTFEALFDYATAFAMQPLPKGNRVAIVTNAGGPGIIAADAVENSGMSVAQLDSARAQALRSKLPAAASVGNPIDVLGDADPERYALAVQAALEDDRVDAVIVILTPQAMTKPAETARAIARFAGGQKPLLACFMGGSDVMPARAELVLSRLPDYTSPERAVSALKAMVDYAAWRNRPPRIITRFPVNRRRVERIILRQSKLDLKQVLEPQAKDILRAYDFTVPDGRIAYQASEAVDVAEMVGYPVVIKVVSPDIIHKSDMGGVKLNLGTASAVRDAYDLMLLRIKRLAPQARIEGIYVEKMAMPAQEVILGMTRDPQFGPMLMFGLGGIFVEVMKDVTFYLAPITFDDAMQMLEGTKSYALLKGARGHAGADITEIARGIQRISQLVTDFPQIAEMDINPFMVGPVGAKAVAADARITLSSFEVKK
ncbi:MAG: CoA-binding protein [Myxococcales bacterium]|nr:MAG: CoA-binding protein [Myxococcales bacterium]